MITSVDFRKSLLMTPYKYAQAIAARLGEGYFIKKTPKRVFGLNFKDEVGSVFQRIGRRSKKVIEVVEGVEGEDIGLDYHMTRIRSTIFSQERLERLLAEVIKSGCPVCDL
jgi:hypothetical protein